MIENFMHIKIDDIDISDYSTYYVLNHVVKKSEPKRSDDFSLSNINEIEQAEIPEIFIKFRYLTLDLYRQIFKATRKNEFKVEYYDQDYDMIRTKMFYLKDSSSLNPHAWGGNWYGFKDFQLNLVCTMNPISNLDIQIFREKVELTKPYYFGEISRGVRVPLQIKTLMNSLPIMSKVLVSFSNDAFELSGVGVTNVNNNYSVETKNSEQQINLSINPSVKRFYNGEYIMYISLDDENSAKFTISCIIKVV